MKIEEALAISDHPNNYTHNEQVLARMTLADAIEQVRKTCDQVDAGLISPIEGHRRIRETLEQS